MPGIVNFTELPRRQSSDSHTNFYAVRLWQVTGGKNTGCSRSFLAGASGGERWPLCVLNCFCFIEKKKLSFPLWFGPCPASTPVGAPPSSGRMNCPCSLRPILYLLNDLLNISPSLLHQFLSLVIVPVGMQACLHFTSFQRVPFPVSCHAISLFICTEILLEMRFLYLISHLSVFLFIVPSLRSSWSSL